MLKDIRSKVMRIANRLVGQGYVRANAMITAWKLIRYRALKTKVTAHHSITVRMFSSSFANTILLILLLSLSVTV